MKKIIVDVTVDDVEKRKNPDKHYEYVIRVKWSEGRINVVYRRYSRFYDLQCKLLDNFLRDGGIYDPKDRILPFLPGKILFGRSNIRKVALNRLEPINDYCKKLITMPAHISQCKFVIDFFETCPEDLLPTNDFSEEDSDTIIGESISDPILLEQYNVIADYVKDGRNETKLKVGWTVDVVEKNETGWWFVRTEEGQGWVPSSYLEKADGGSDDRLVPMAKKKRSSNYVCTQTYVAQESDEIKLDKGCFVEVLEKNLDGWWLVRYKGKEGRAPATYLIKTDTLKVKRLMKRSLKTDDAGPEIVSNIGAVTTLENLQNKYQGNLHENSVTGGQETNSNDQLVRNNLIPFKMKNIRLPVNNGRFQKNIPQAPNKFGGPVHNNNERFQKNAFTPSSNAMGANNVKGNISKNIFIKQDGASNLGNQLQNNGNINNVNKLQIDVPQEQICSDINIPGRLHNKHKDSSNIQQSSRLGIDVPSQDSYLPMAFGGNARGVKSGVGRIGINEDEAIYVGEDGQVYENVGDVITDRGNVNESDGEIDSSSEDSLSLDSSSISSGADMSPQTQLKLPPRRETLQRGIAKDSSPKQNIYTAIADFKNTQGDGINLKKSEVLKVLEKTETGWWLVRGDQGEGWAPSSYIHKDVVQEPIAPPRPAMPPVKSNRPMVQHQQQPQLAANTQLFSSKNEPVTSKENGAVGENSSLVSELSNVFGKLNKSDAVSVIDSNQHIHKLRQVGGNNPVTSNREPAFSEQHVGKISQSSGYNVNSSQLSSDGKSINNSGAYPKHPVTFAANPQSNIAVSNNKPVVNRINKPSFQVNSNNGKFVNQTESTVVNKPQLPRKQKPVELVKPVISQSPKPQLPVRKKNFVQVEAPNSLETKKQGLNSQSDISVKNMMSLFEKK